jgi:hypothetical protein
LIDCKETVRVGVEGSPRAVLAVLEYILIPKYTNFYGKNAGGNAGTLKRGSRHGASRMEDLVDKLVSNMESSFEGHTVDALVLTGDEGRDKLR